MAKNTAGVAATASSVMLMRSCGAVTGEVCSSGSA